MRTMRAVIRKGDLTTHQGTVIEGCETDDVFGLPPAGLGHLVLCPKCPPGVHRIAEGESSFLIDGRPVALEGMKTTCGALLVPSQILMRVKQTSIAAIAASPAFVQDALARAWVGTIFPEEVEEVALKRSEVDTLVDAEQTELICPNMTNEAFGENAMVLRDLAVDYITGQRLPELARWDDAAQARARTWFGTADQPLREYLQDGLTACVTVLRGLQPKNFIRYTEGGKIAECVMGSAQGIAAAVCKPDTATHTIAIGLPFCTFPDEHLNFETKIPMDGDSRLLTLLHEVTHFHDTFDSTDDWYSTRYSRGQSNKTARARVNADSLAAYILGVE